MKRILPFFLAVMLLFAACASAPDAPDGDLRERFLAGANAVVVTDDAVTFPDDSGSGEPVTLAKNPANPAILYASFVTLWCEAGGIPSGIVGGSSAKELYREVIGRDITADAGVTVLADSAMAKRWDIESILAAQPDVIFCSAAMSGYATISAPAKAAGIPVAAVDYDDFADYLKWFKVFCNLTGHPELWDEIANATAERIIEVVEQVPEVEKAPRVLIFRETLKSFGNNCQTGQLVWELGGVNVVETDPINGMTDSVDLGMEEIYALDPDMILIPCMNEPGSTEKEIEELVGSDPVWNELRAVKEGKVFFIEKGLFHNKPNKDFRKAYEAMFGYLYPDCELTEAKDAAAE